MSVALLLSLLLLTAPVLADAAPPEPVKRSSAPRRAFIRENPCPANGARDRSPCPGWRVDHIIPLACGGPDTPANMQWLTVEQHKAKSKWERKPCPRR